MIDDLKKNVHTVIDASAGTGKTYTICEIVIDRLKKGYNIEEFIIMTYTEKAAGELISRIREKIINELKASLSDKEKTNLQRALKNFDYATISTIHGFCQKVLKEYAFECNVPYTQELDNDNDFLKYAYGDITFKSLIDKLEKLSDKDVEKLFSKEIGGYEKHLFKIANDINLDRDILLPNPNNYKFEIKDHEVELLNKFYGVDFNELRDYLLGIKTQKGTINTHAKGLRDKLEPLFNYYKKKGIQNINSILSDFKLSNTEIKFLNEFYSEKYSGSPEEILEIINANNGVIDNYNNYLLGFKAQIIKDVTKQYEDIKRNNLTITFNDMILLVANSLKNEKSPLKSIMQKRYKIGIIDEFQDTSPAQWNIAKEIFLERENTQETLPYHLIIVGDEKQSIYSFQGANVETYKEAKRVMEDVYNAQKINLKYNYRSSKEILDCFNRIFSQKDKLDNDFWFPYTNVLYPKEHGYNKEVNKNDTPLVVYPIDSKNKNMAGDYPNFIANEIKNIKRKGYEYSDICVLIREKKDANILINTFNNYKIPYTQYKKEGLYNSLEGNELFILLSALSFPYNKQYIKDLILTRFFPEYGIKSLNIDEGLLSDIEKKLDNWRDCFDKYGFYYMMDKIFMEQDLFANLLCKNFFPENPLAEADTSERSITNFKHIVKKLIDGGNKNNSLLDYYNTLNDYRTDANKEETFQECDTEKSKVQIMTMHASKGLEFKVVFIYGPFGTTRNQSIYSITQKENKIYALDKNTPIFDACDKDFQNQHFVLKTEAERIIKEKIDNLSKLIPHLQNELAEKISIFGEDNFDIIKNYYSKKANLDKAKKDYEIWKNNPYNEKFKDAEKELATKEKSFATAEKKFLDKNFSQDQLDEYDDLVELNNEINSSKKEITDEENKEWSDGQFLDSLSTKLDIEETKRLLYVAFTRAKDKLYLPYIRTNEKEGGKKTLVEDIINNGIRNIYKEYECDTENYYNYSGEEEVKNKEIYIPHFIEQDTHIEDVSKKQRYVNSFSNRYGIDFVELGIVTKEESDKLDLTNKAYLEEINVSNDNPGLDYSYYGENSELSKEDKEEEYKEFSKRDEIIANAKKIITGKPQLGLQGTMPGGTRIGNMLHEIFEKINFANIMDKGVYGKWEVFQKSDSNERYVIEEITNKYGLSDKYLDNVLGMVWNTLHTPVIGNFAIGNITKAFKEIQFELKLNDKYLTGIIDMVFECNDKIYILDWKSNKSSDGNYGDKDVEEIMKEHAYYLQYGLYKKAVNEWLKLNRINKEVSGGFYVFLRNAEKGNKAKIVALK